MIQRMSRFQQIASSAPHAVGRQRLLERAADRMLRNDGFFPKREKSEDEYIPVDADYISNSGHLKPISGRP